MRQQVVGAELDCRAGQAVGGLQQVRGDEVVGSSDSSCCVRVVVTRLMAAGESSRSRSPPSTSNAPSRPLRIIPTSKVRSSRSLDRKSTRLNSSHVKISYAVFCLK